MPRDEYGNTSGKDWSSETMSRAMDVVEERKRREEAARKAAKAKKTKK